MPASHRPTNGAQLRSRVEAAVERLIDLLDALDADPDCEDQGDDEPSLGSTNGIDQRRTCIGQTFTVDAEPSLGWTEIGPQAICRQSDDDRELEEERELDYAEDGFGDMDGLNEQRGVDGLGELYDGPDPWRQ